MIQYETFTLSNGLKVILHRDPSTPMVAVNVLYRVGSKHEAPNRTGFAHLFEHLMFGGTKHVPDFDLPIQMAGGENNAFTNQDVTNFYSVLPKANLETALWLESDRMRGLLINEKALNVQKKVVVEEFKEVCLNQPFGDAWHHINGLAYKNYVYEWPTIGKSFDHIEEANLDDVQLFYDTYYQPSNAILSIAGGITLEATRQKVEKWFGPIENETRTVRVFGEPTPIAQKISKTIKSESPAEAIYMAFPMSDRISDQYYGADLLSDTLGNGRSSRFFKELYKNKEMFTTIDAYISGNIEPGLFVIESKLKDHVSIETAREVIWEQIYKLQADGISEHEWHKLQNKVESSHLYGEINVLNKAINLAFYTLLGDTSLINRQVEYYRSWSHKDLQDLSKSMLQINQHIEVVYAK